VSKKPPPSLYDQIDNTILPGNKNLNNHDPNNTGTESSNTHQLYDVNKTRNDRNLKRNVSFSRNLSVSQNNLNTSYNTTNNINYHVNDNDNRQNDNIENEVEEEVEEVDDDDEDSINEAQDSNQIDNKINNIATYSRNGALSNRSNWNFSKGREVSPKKHWNYSTVINRTNPSSNKDKLSYNQMAKNYVSRKQQTYITSFVDPEPFNAVDVTKPNDYERVRSNNDLKCFPYEKCV
jgi:hypothetical protein